MPRYVVFLRGVNVGGHHRMAMADLRDALEAVGFEAVETYLASGNVHLETPATDGAAVRRDVAAAIDDAFGFDVDVMVRTAGELAAVVAGQPFDDPAADDPADVARYVTFLHEAPDDGAVEALLAAGSEAEQFIVRDREVYSRLDKAVLGPGRFTDVGSVLGQPATRRTWTVVTAVADRWGSA